MGVYYYWADVERKQCLDAGIFGENVKAPYGPKTAEALFALMQAHAWETITLIHDMDDMPWEVESGWTELPIEAFEAHDGYMVLNDEWWWALRRKTDR